MDVRRLGLLRELAQRGSVTAVARAMHLTPSAVSQQLKALEREAGVALLQRSGRGIALTPPGRVLADTARDLALSLASKSPIALRLAKESMNRVEHLPLKEAYRTEQDYTARLLGFEDAAEARNAYMEKRQPEWKWK